ncbi:MAG TPA: tetratricopeptide repeat protein [Dictyobacter sp.]|nr:tetratricopeptide repeat protein [Dictyobacter sp.]
MTQASSMEEKLRLKKQWTDLAIKQAQEGLWEEAVTTNKNILNFFSQEPDAYNRLGKALSELGLYSDARQAYSQTLKYSPSNVIAKKNLIRLESLQDAAAPVVTGVAGRIDPRMFIEETGKTAETDLINLASATILARFSVGDRLHLNVDGHRLLAQNAAGETVGQIEPRMANRLISFIEGGNRYAAGIRILAIEDGIIRIIVREEYQHPDMFGKVSFPSQGSGEQVRAYIKDSILRYDREDDDEIGNDDEYYDGGDESEEMSEMEFENDTHLEE